ncbi:MAG: PAS domain-containing protein, partial [Thermodesulfobacteriota bacterium]
MIQNEENERMSHAESLDLTAAYSSRFDDASVGVLLVTGDATVVYGNRAAARMLAVEPVEFVGRSLDSLEP